MKKYKYLIFDLDDTLIDNLENIKHAFKAVLQYMNINHTEKDLEYWYELDKNFWADWQNDKIIVPDEYKEPKNLMVSWVRAQRFLIFFNNTISLEKAIELSELYMENLKVVVLSVDGAYATLNELSKRYEIIVATNGPSIAARDKLEKIDCLKFVKYVFSADMFGYMKPAIEFFEGIKEELNCHNNEDFLVIGDSLFSDVRGATNAKMDSCWFNINNDELTIEYEPTFIINTLNDLTKKI